MEKTISLTPDSESFLGRKIIFGMTGSTLVAYGVLAVFILAVILDGPGWITYPLSVGWSFLSVLGGLVFGAGLYFLITDPKTIVVEASKGKSVVETLHNSYEMLTKNSSSWKMAAHFVVNVFLVYVVYTSGWETTAILWACSMSIAMLFIQMFKAKLPNLILLAKLKAASGETED